MNEYTQIEAEFDDPLAPCDSICILILSGGFQTSENTVLKVDDVTLNYSNVAVEDHQEHNFDVYPNPASEVLNVKSTDGSFTYRLLDLTGRQIRTGAADGRAAINVSSLPAGVYMLQLNSESKTITQKVIVR
jgi:hypothetical protein